MATNLTLNCRLVSHLYPQYCQAVDQWDWWLVLLEVKNCYKVVVTSRAPSLLSVSLIIVYNFQFPGGCRMADVR